MIIEIVGGTIKYTADTGDWLAEVVADGSNVLITFASNTGSMEMSSGINYDNLAVFIGDVKADAIAKGVNWSGN